MDSDVRGDVVALDRGGAALAPGAGQVQVVRRLAANMALADMFLRTMLDGSPGLTGDINSRRGLQRWGSARRILATDIADFRRLS
jgi:hypothetical protein